MKFTNVLRAIGLILFGAVMAYTFCGQSRTPIKATNAALCVHYMDKTDGTAISDVQLRVSKAEGGNGDQTIAMRQVNSLPFSETFEATITPTPGETLSIYTDGHRDGQLYYPFNQIKNPTPAPTNIRMWLTVGACEARPSSWVIWDTNDPKLEYGFAKMNPMYWVRWTVTPIPG